MKDSMATSKPVSWRRKRILDLLSSYQTRGRENSPTLGLFSRPSFLVKFGILDYNQDATKRGMCNFNNRGAYESVIPATQNDDAIRNLRSGEIVSDLPYFLRLNARC